MKTLPIIPQLLLTTLIFWGVNLKAQDSLTVSKKDDIFSLSIEELTNATVITPSSTEERFIDAPSSITVFTKEEIEKLGIDNMYDLFNYTPGFQSERALWLGEIQLVHARGYVGDNPYILVKIDGIDINEVSLGTTNVYSRYLQLFPVKQVEIIRGPGSALYGTSACLGVVNLITDPDAKKARVAFGSQERTNFSFRYGDMLASELKINIGADHYSDIGAEFLIDSLYTRDPRKYRKADFALQYKGVHFTTIYADEKTEDFIAFGKVANGINFFKNKNFFSRLSYKWKVNNKLLITPSATFSQWHLDLVGLIVPAGMAGSSHDFFGGPYSKSSKYNGTLKIDYDIKEKDHLQFGAEASSYGLDISGAYSNHLAPDSSVIAPVEKFYLGKIIPHEKIGSFMSSLVYLQSYGTYLQYKRQWNDQILTYIGGRYDYYSVAKNAFSPRLSLIYHTPFNGNIKILYGEAFRAPVHNELYGDTPSGFASSTLAPEKIKTAEASYSHYFKHGFMEVTYFYTSISEMIQIIPYSEDPSLLTVGNNDSAFISHGFEFHSKQSITRNIDLNATATFIIDSDSEKAYKKFGTVTLNYSTPKFKASATALLRLKREYWENETDYVLIRAKCDYKVNNKVKVYAKSSNMLNSKYFTNSLRREANDRTLINRGIEFESGFTFNLK